MLLKSLCPIMPRRDIAVAADFWVRLGFAPILQTSDCLILARDGAEVHFFHAPDHDPLEDAPSAYLRPSDIDALDAERAGQGLASTGTPRLMPAEDKPWGMRELALIDPDGNLIRAGGPIDHG